MKKETYAYHLTDTIFGAILLVIVALVIILSIPMQYYATTLDPVMVVEAMDDFGAVLSASEDDNRDEIMTKKGDTFTLKLTAFGGKVEEVSLSSVKDFLVYSSKGEEKQTLEITDVNVYDNVVYIDMVAKKEGSYQINFSKGCITNTDGESSAPSNTVWVQVKND